MIEATVKSENEIEIESDLSDVLAEISGIMHEAIIAEMELGEFTPRSDGSPSYLGGRGGSIARSLGHESTDSTAVAGVFNVLPYSYIHQFGGPITVTERSRGFFWFMHKQTNDSMWKAMALKYQVGDTIQMPKREYIHFTEPLVGKILDKLRDKIVTFKQGTTTYAA